MSVLPTTYLFQSLDRQTFSLLSWAPTRSIPVTAATGWAPCPCTVERFSPSEFHAVIGERLLADLRGFWSRQRSSAESSCKPRLITEAGLDAQRLVVVEMGELDGELRIQVCHLDGTSGGHKYFGDERRLKADCDRESLLFALTAAFESCRSFRWDDSEMQHDRYVDAFVDESGGRAIVTARAIIAIPGVDPRRRPVVATSRVHLTLSEFEKSGQSLVISTLQDSVASASAEWDPDVLPSIEWKRIMISAEGNEELVLTPFHLDLESQTYVKGRDPVVVSVVGSSSQFKDRMQIALRRCLVLD